MPPFAGVTTPMQSKKTGTYNGIITPNIPDHLLHPLFLVGHKSLLSTVAWASDSDGNDHSGSQWKDPYIPARRVPVHRTRGGKRGERKQRKKG